MKQILLVDDDAIVTHLYRMVFEREGLDVRTAGDGEAALREIEARTPDLVVLDLMLPKIHGIEIIKRLRAQPTTAAIPVIVLSNSYLATMVKAAWQAGANQCLTKAECSPERLSEVVRGYLGLSPKTSAAAPAPPAGGNVAAAQPGGSAGATGGSTEAQTIPFGGDQSSNTTTFLRPGQTASGPRHSKVIPNGTPFSGSEPDAAAQRLASFLPGVIVALKSTSSNIDTLQAQNLFLPKLRELHGLLSPQPPIVATPSSAQVIKLATTLAAMLTEILDDPEALCFSTLRTTAGACEVLTAHLGNPDAPVRVRSTAPLVLVVDDEVISRKTVSAALEIGDLRTVCVDEPDFGLQLLKENTFDIVLLDVDMPSMDGYQTCERLRQLPLHKQTPVIFVTGAAAMENRARSLLSGANDIITKPFLLHELAVKALTFICRAQGKAVKPAR